MLMPLPRHAVFNHNDQLVKYNGHNSILTLTAIAAAIAKDKAHKNVVRVGPRYVGQQLHPVCFIRDSVNFALGVSLNYFRKLPSSVPYFVS